MIDGTSHKEDVTTFDAIGDIHGCYYELIELIEKLGYKKGEDDLYEHPEGRILVFLGDITDRGWYNSMSLQFVIRHWRSGKALWVQGNHDNKLFRWMIGNPVRIAHGLQKTVLELKQVWPFAESMEELGAELLESVPTKILLDGGNVVAVHAYPEGGQKNHIYGLMSGPGNERVEWWEDYDNSGPYVLFGHYWLDDPTPRDSWCCLDTSCCRGGHLSAMRWPEKEIVQVQAKSGYS